jgi:hypothetical protein
MSTKLNETAYVKIVCQAEEARDVGLKSLANDVFSVIGPTARTEHIAYSSEDLDGDVGNALWKVATDVVAYHDLDSVDIQKINATVRALVGVVRAAIEEELGVGSVGPLEPKLPGQK